MGKGLGRPLRWGAVECEPGIEFIKLPSEVVEMIGALDTPRVQDKLAGYCIRYFLGLDPEYPTKALKPLCIACKTHIDRIKTGIKTGGIRKSPPAEMSQDPTRVPATCPSTPYTEPEPYPYSEPKHGAGGEAPKEDGAPSRTPVPPPECIDDVLGYLEEMAGKGHVECLGLAHQFYAVYDWYEKKASNGWTQDGEPIRDWRKLLLAFAQRFKAYGERVLAERGL